MINEDLWSTVRRFEYLGFTVIAYMIAYYLWTFYGYLDLFVDLVQWTISIVGAFVAIYAMTGHSMRIQRRTTYLLAGGNTALILTIIIKFGLLNTVFDPVILFLGFVDYFLLRDVFSSGLGNPMRFAYVFAAVMVSMLSIISVVMRPGLVTMVVAVLLFSAGILSYFRFHNLIHPALIASVVLFALSILPIYPKLGTDELALDYYAAIVILHGSSPYMPQVMKNAFSFLHFPLSMTTPLSTGGYVENFSYPVFAALMFIPSAIMHFDPSLTILAFTVGIYIITAIYFLRKRMIVSSVLSIAILAVNVNMISFADGSVPDAAWAFFLLISMMIIDRPRSSAVMYGIAISLKQIPWIVFPFLIYFIYREKGTRAAIEYLAISIGILVLTNAYFLIMEPHLFISSILSPEISHLIGVGQGLSIISIAGFYQLSPIYFTILFLFSLTFIFLLYVRHYQDLKYTFLIFPLIIFFFNYRDLYNYLLFWPFIAFAFLPHLKAGEMTRRMKIGIRKIAVYSIIFLAVAGILSVPLHSQSSFSITSVSNIEQRSYYVVQMNVNVSYSGDQLQQIQFRFLPYGYLGNLNGLMWNVKSYDSGPNWINFTIEPSFQQSMLNVNYSYKLVAYYGDQQTFYFLDLPSILSGSVHQ
ncbi:glycosyltransferase family 87 protein [Thermoplasma sp.]|uniref:glycosyltransferase family 87 protein n=1 Tax=Thermoplasma sp. TaxID=1973142 RepID=UPI002600657D|nr:glycosyltransferase family 87 protein [Thermoplasma sp.]